jgi:pimeloyl-ACP methyl ester carboxylesterase
MANLRELSLHGHRVSYRAGGDGPVLLLIHGITSSSASWEPVLPLLEEHYTVIAPDLLGHGASAKPTGDYSLGAYACMVRDLMLALGHESATVVGHSLGGGVAMQIAYQFPGLVDRLVLVSSGGLGREVSVFLRAATLPGAEYVLPLIASRPVLASGEAVARTIGRLGLRLGADLGEIASGIASLAEQGARSAFVHTARSVIDPGGQRVDARDRLYLSEAVPSLLVWGERDPIIPAEHGVRAHGLMPGSRLERFEGAGHFPYLDDPLRFTRVLREFVDGTEPAGATLAGARELMLRRAGQDPVGQAVADQA